MSVGRAELVGADTEGLAERAADRDEEPAGDAGGGCRLGHRCLGPEGLVPAVGGAVQPVAGQDAGAPHAEFLGDGGDGTPYGYHGAVGDVGVLGLDQFRHLGGDDRVRRRYVLARPARLQPQVLGVGGQQVAGAHVARAQPLAPRHPLGREQRILAGKQHRFVEGDVLGAGGARHGDGPAPAPVAGVLALEEVRDDPVALRDGGDVLAHH